MQGTPDSTEKSIVPIAQGKLDLDRASQPLDKIFDAQGYWAVLHDSFMAQQSIDGLYKVYCPCFYKYPFRLALVRLLATTPFYSRNRMRRRT